MLRDCLVAENWYPLLQNPNTLDPRTLIGEYAFAKCAPAEVIAFRRASPLSRACSRGRTRRGRFAGVE